MARLDKNGFLKGKKGDTIYRKLNNKSVVSQRPVMVKQAENSKITAFEFGLACNTARSIRLAFNSFHAGLDGSFCNRLNSAVRIAFQSSGYSESGKRDFHDSNIHALENTQFNSYSPLDKIFKLRPEIRQEDNSTITVSLPPFSTARELAFPRSALNIGCTLRITLCAFDFRKEFYFPMGFRDMDLTSPEGEGFSWNFDECAPPGSVLLVCMSLHYFITDPVSERKDLGIKEYSPAEIIGAFRIPSERQFKKDVRRSETRLAAHLESPEQTTADEDTAMHDKPLKTSGVSTLPAGKDAAEDWNDLYLPLEGYKGNTMLRNINSSWPY